MLSDCAAEVIIQVGTNDISGRNRRNVSNEQVADDIIGIGEKCRVHGVGKIYISSIFVTRNLNSNEKAKHINSLLKNLCIEHDFTYICNYYLTITDLKNNDYVPLSGNGLIKLVNNYITILNGY